MLIRKKKMFDDWKRILFTSMELSFLQYRQCSLTVKEMHITFLVLESTDKLHLITIHASSNLVLPFSKHSFLLPQTH